MATNGYQLIGVGQMQKSMAGAVTAAPMDTMTAISNPAGMARVGNRADFSLEAFMPVRSVDFAATGGTSNEGGTEIYGVPSVGWVAGAFDRDDMYFGGGMFATSGLGVDYDQIRMAPAGALTSAEVTFSGHSAIQFWKMAPTVAWNASDDLSLGVSLNLDYQSITIDQKIRSIVPPVAPSVVPTDVRLDLGRPTSQLGFGASIGVLYDLNPMITLGASYTSQQNFADAKFRVGDDDVLAYNGATGTAGVYKLDLDYPQQAAIGIAVSPNDRLLVDVDIKWIDWSSTHDSVNLSGPTGSFNGGAASETELPFGWEDQTIYAIGVQWLATDSFTIRAGYNYAEAPIDEADVLNNLIFPAAVEQHLAIGFDKSLGDHWGVGGTYMKAFKKTFTGVNDTGGFAPLLGGSPSSGAKLTLEETSVGVLLYYLM
jgi:long-chain fatty acid transport protein